MFKLASWVCFLSFFLPVSFSKTHSTKNCLGLLRFFMLSFFLETFWEGKKQENFNNFSLFFLLYYFLLKQFLLDLFSNPNMLDLDVQQFHYNHVSQSSSRKFGDSFAGSGKAELDAWSLKKISTNIKSSRNISEKIVIFHFFFNWFREKNLWWFKKLDRRVVVLKFFTSQMYASHLKKFKTGRSSCESLYGFQV